MYPGTKFKDVKVDLSDRYAGHLTKLIQFKEYLLNVYYVQGTRLSVGNRLLTTSLTFSHRL